MVLLVEDIFDIIREKILNSWGIFNHQLEIIRI